MEKQNNNTNKLTDKAFSRLMLTSVLSMLVCIVCLCSATWAWFSTDVSNHSNTIESGQFDLDVTIQDPTDNKVDLVKDSDGKMIYTFETAGLYTVTLVMTDDTTVTKGFCVMKVGDVSYYTSSINAETDQFTFTIDVKQSGISITFAAAWGYPAAENLIAPDGTLQIGSATIEELH